MPGCRPGAVTKSSPSGDGRRCEPRGFWLLVRPTHGGAQLSSSILVLMTGRTGACSENRLGSRSSSGLQRDECVANAMMVCQSRKIALYDGDL